MVFKSPKHTRRSIRLKEWDYSRPGAYFVTLCLHNRDCLFGSIVNDTMQLNEFGGIIREKWEWLEKQYAYVKLDEYIVMPNHFHGIVWICDIHGRGGSRTAPTNISTSHAASTNESTLSTSSQIILLHHPQKIKPIGRLIGAFKTVSAKQINICRRTMGAALWQRDFYDHIGRNENELNRIRQYIKNNPMNWDSDEENPINKSPRYVAMPNPQRQCR